jgi:outer membrane protein TolC
LRLTSDVVDQVTRVRQAWVRAVAAQQTLKYAKQVYDSAEAGAELAKRMQAWATSTGSPVHASRLSTPMPPPG